MILCICDIAILCFCDITKIFCFCDFHDQNIYNTLLCFYHFPLLQNFVTAGLLLLQVPMAAGFFWSEMLSLSLSLSIYISLSQLTCFDIAVAIYLSSACLQLQLHLLCTLLCMLMAVSSVPCFCNPWNCWFCTFQAATRSMTAYR